jgi:DNA polymerase
MPTEDPIDAALTRVLKEVALHVSWQASDGQSDVLHVPPARGPAKEEQPRAEISRSPVVSPASGAAKEGQPRAEISRSPVVPPARPAAAPAPLRTEPERKRQTVEEVRQELGDCHRCKLCRGRSNIVFGVGNPKAELVFVGEGPGAEEDAQGIPFVGAAGQLLTKMIEAMGFSRDAVYICNVIKCRPPGNRDPEPDEIESCQPFLHAQLASIEPRVIVAMGRVAAQTLLRDPTAITRMRGQWREYRGVPLMPTFHPAYLLRNPGDKRKAWSDLQQVMKALGKGVRKEQ